MIRPFTQDDVADAVKLCRAAGWNQLPRDWSRLIQYEPDGCWVAEVNGRLVGTVTTTRYGHQLAWIGMMLVDPDYRRRGVATALIGTSIEYLQKRGIRCIKLDATPAGKLVYQRLGFQTEWAFHRWQRDSAAEHQAAADRPQRVPDAREAKIESFTTLDRKAFGADRIHYLDRLARNSSICYRYDGLGMVREGHLASYLGPLIAANPHTAADVVDDLLSSVAGRVFWDVPQPNPYAVRLAEQRGFARVRDLERMWLGERLSPQLNLQYALSDPGTG